MVGGIDGGAVDRRDHIPRLKLRVGGGRVRAHLCDGDAAVRVVHDDAEPRPLNRDLRGFGRGRGGAGGVLSISDACD